MSSSLLYFNNESSIVDEILFFVHIMENPQISLASIIICDKIFLCSSNFINLE